MSCCRRAKLKQRFTVDVRAEVDLADVVVLQDGGVSRVGGVVGCTVVEGAAGGEGQSSVQPVLLYQLTGAILQALAGRRSKTLKPGKKTSKQKRLDCLKTTKRTE